MCVCVCEGRLRPFCAARDSRFNKNFNLANKSLGRSEIGQYDKIARMIFGVYEFSFFEVDEIFGAKKLVKSGFEMGIWKKEKKGSDFELRRNVRYEKKIKKKCWILTGF